jgi:hypothetical protein
MKRNSFILQLFLGLTTLQRYLTTTIYIIANKAKGRFQDVRPNLAFSSRSFAFIALILGGVNTQLHCATFDLSICAVFRDEGLYLKEWIEFHKIVGVQHFYLYNNLSTDNYLEILSPYIESGEVELFDWPADTHSERDYLDYLQLPVYNHGLNIAKETSRWIAFIDLDEFLFPVKHENLIEMLKEYEFYAGIAVNWVNYGTSWLDTLPANGLIIENLIYRARTDYPRNRIVKMVVQPQYVQSIHNPHYFEYNEDHSAVNSAKETLIPDQIMHPIIIDTVRINHYWSGPLDWLMNH